MARAATARLFIALDPPVEVCDELSSWAREAVAGWRSWTRRVPRVLERASLHLTLCFLGNRPVGEIDALAAALERCTGTVGELSFGAPVWLPPRRPHALAVEVRDQSGELATLQADVVRALSQASEWEPERLRFRPHVTVVRMREGPRGRDAMVLPATPQVAFEPESMVLYRSRLTPAGSEYEALAWSPLKGPGG